MTTAILQFYEICLKKKKKNMLSQLYHIKESGQVINRFSHSKPIQMNASIIDMETGKATTVTKDT